MSQKSQTTIPDWKLERYLLGELSSVEMQMLKETLESDANVSLRLEKLQRENEKLLEKVPVPFMTQKIQSGLRAKHKLSKPSSDLGRNWGLVFKRLSPVMILLVAAILVPLYIARENSVGLVDTRIKGMEPTLNLYLQTPEGAKKIHEKEKFREKDRIQVTYNSFGKKHGVIFSIDGRGNLTWHLPELDRDMVEQSRAQSALLKGNGEHRLPHSYQLDDAPEWEVFYFITADEPFGMVEILPSINNRLEGLFENEPQSNKELSNLPQHFRQYVQVLYKESTP